MRGTDISARGTAADDDVVKVLTFLMIDHSLPLWSGVGRDATAGSFG